MLDLGWIVRWADFCIEIQHVACDQVTMISLQIFPNFYYYYQMPSIALNIYSSSIKVQQILTNDFNSLIFLEWHAVSRVVFEENKLKGVL